MDDLLGPGMSALETAMRFRMARERVLAGNVANADTPRYRRHDLSFDQKLGRAMGVLRQTHPQHLPDPSAAGGDRYKQEVGPRGTRPDGNGVDLDNELMQVHRNAGAFTKQAAVMARMSRLVKTAIGGGS